MREQHKDYLDKVAALVLSHLKAQSKSKLVFAVMDEVKNSGPSLSNPESRLHKVLQGLAALEAKSSTAVSLKAREVMITGQMPSLEERTKQMETILKASVSTNYYGEQGYGSKYVLLHDQRLLLC